MVGLWVVVVSGGVGRSGVARRRGRRGQGAVHDVVDGSHARRTHHAGAADGAPTRRAAGGARGQRRRLETSQKQKRNINTQEILNS